MQRIAARPLTKMAFEPFGDVIETEGLMPRIINKGFARRFTDLCRVDTAEAGGTTGVSIFEASPRVLPIRLDLMERHPLGSQAFVPLSPDPFVVVVGWTGSGDIADLEAFVSNGRQGVCYARGVWHHPLLALVEQRFLVIDRLGSGRNLEESPIASAITVELP